MPKPKSIDQPVVEADPRFPSGRWIGFWLQTSRPGRHAMALTLTFIDGRIAGTGSDWVGDFDFSGRYDLRDGGVKVTKDYLGGHRVSYEGRNENDGQWIWGLWTIESHDRGGFHLWPAGEDDPTQPKLRAERELPVAQRRVRLSPIGIG